MFLTPEQFQAVQKIIERYHNAFIAAAIGPGTLPPEVLKELKKHGLLDPQVEAIKASYLYGQLVAILQNSQVAKMSYDQFTKYLEKNPIPLTDIEKHAAEMASQNAAQYCRGLGNKVNLQTGTVLIEADKKLRAKMEGTIRDATARNIVLREGVQKLKSDLGWRTKDWARDLGRIALTEKQTAMQQGTADHYGKKYGKGVLVARRAMPDACQHCKRLHNGPDGFPRIFRLSQLEANGTNVGRKAAEWLPVVGTVHPNCQCITIRVPDGWGFDEDGTLVPGGKYGEHYSGEEDLELALAEEMELQKSIQMQSRLTFQGIPITIENRKNSVRRWTDAEGNSGETKLTAAYGYIEGTGGADGDAIDAFVGPNPRAKRAYVIEQQNPHTGGWDEVKVMLGFSNQQEAERVYRENYDDPEKFFLMTNPMEIDALKRWVAETVPEFVSEPAGPLRKSGPTPVIPFPLEKAQVDANIGAATSPAGNRNPALSPGVGVNYVIPLPKWVKPKQPLPKLEGIQQPLDTPYTPDPLKRDPEIYLFRENVPVVTRPVIIPDSWGEMMEQARAGSEERKMDVLHRQRMESVAALPNSPVGEKEDEEEEEEIAKAGIITYGKFGGKIVGYDAKGNPIYLRDEPTALIAKTGGKAEPDKFRPDTHVIIKVPLAEAGALEAWRAKEGLEGKVSVGGKYARLSVARAHVIHPDAPAAVQAERTFAPTEVPAVQGIAPTSKALEAPAVLPGHLFRGQVVRLGGEVGALLGTDQLGSPVVQLPGGKRVRTKWGELKPEGGAAGYSSPASKLPAGRVYQPTERQQKLIDQTLAEVDLAGGHVANEFLDWLWSKGQETFVVGGVIRDLVQGTTAGLGDPEILEMLKDVDVVTGANPVLVKQCFEDTLGLEFGLHYEAGGAPWAVLRLLYGGMGLDAATLGQEGLFSNANEARPDIQQKLATHHEKAPKVVLDHDLQADSARRDFCFNALFYDPRNKVVIDPTGTGISDAQNKILRLAAGTPERAMENELLGFRYLKFRERNYTPTQEAHDVSRARMQKTCKEYSSKDLARQIFKIYLAKKPTEEGIEPTLEKMKKMMVNEGWGDIWDKYIEGRLKSIKEYMGKAVAGAIEQNAEAAKKEKAFQEYAKKKKSKKGKAS